MMAKVPSPYEQFPALGRQELLLFSHNLSYTYLSNHIRHHLSYSSCVQDVGPAKGIV